MNYQVENFTIHIICDTRVSRHIEKIYTDEFDSME